MQTATNPQTGEKVQWNGSAWVPLGGSAPASGGQVPAMPQGPQPVVVGTPRPKPEPVPSGFRPDGRGGLVPIPGGPADPARPGGPLDPNRPDKAPKETADQRAAAGFYSRALNAHRKYGEGIEPRGAVTQTIVDQLPRSIVNEFSSPERREAQNYADEFIRAKLRKESGAVIGAEEMQREYEVYFPQPGDGPADIARKGKLREQALEALKIAAGDVAADVPMDGAGDLGPGKRLPPEAEQRLLELVNGGATPEEIDAFLQPFGLRSPNAGKEPTSPALDYSKIDAPVQQMIDAKMAQNGHAGSAGVMGAVDAVTFGTGDEIVAGGNAFIQSLSGEGSIGDLYERNIGVERGYREQLQGAHPYVYGGGQLIGGAAIPVGIGATGVGGLAKVGAAQGAAYGFGSSEGNPLERLPGAAVGIGVGGAAGAGLGYAAPRVQNALMQFSPKARSARAAEVEAGRPIIEAGSRQDIPIRQPDVRPGLRGDLAAVEKSPSAGPTVGDTLRADRELMESRVAGLSKGGEARDEYALGNEIQGAVSRHNQRTKDEATINYFRARKMAPDHSDPAVKTISAIDDRLLQLRTSGETANAAEMRVLEGIRADIQKSGLSIESLQTQRKAMRQRLKDNGIDTPQADASYMEIMSVAGRELEESLAANPGAREALRKANAHYAERKAFREQVAKQFVGTDKAPVPPETAANRFISMAKSRGDYNRWSRMFGELDPIEKGDFAATIAEGLGRGRNGEFSYGRFVTDLENMNPRALRDLYGKEGADALADLKAIAAAKRDTAAGLNHSNTGSVLARNNGFKDVLLAMMGGSIGNVPGAIAGFFVRGAAEKFASKRAARMLLNPDFTKWLRQTPNSARPEVINRHFARLTSIASRNPGLAGDARALQQALTEALSESATRAAASQDKDD